MTFARLLAAFALALLVFYFSVRGAQAHDVGIPIDEILAAAAQCAPQRCPDPPPPGAIVTVDPTSLSTLVVSARRGWSPSTGGLCYRAEAHHLRGGVPSETVGIGNPPDCIPMPEPSGGLLVGVLALAVLGSRRPTR